jgi:hypothetical protein
MSKKLIYSQEDLDLILELEKVKDEELQQENKQLKKDIKNIIKILDKNCDDLEATEEEFDSLDRWQGLQVVELEDKEVSE